MLIQSDHAKRRLMAIEKVTIKGKIYLESTTAGDCNGLSFKENYNTVTLQ